MFTLLVLFCALTTISTGHISSCPDVNPLAFWMVHGPTAQRPPAIEAREFAMMGTTPPCRTIGRGFNGFTHLVSFVEMNITNTTPAGFLDQLPVTIEISDPGNDTRPCCFNWGVSNRYNVYAVAITKDEYTVAELYGPTATTSGGPLCAGVDGNISAAIVSICYTPVLSVEFVSASYTTWYDVAWNLTVSPAAARAVVCASSDVYARTFRVTATASEFVSLGHTVSGGFEAFGTVDAGAAAAWVVSSDALGRTVVTTIALTCVPHDSDGVTCTFDSQIDHTLVPISVVASVRPPSPGQEQAGFACISLGEAVPQIMRGNDYVLFWNHETTLANGVITSVPTIVGPFVVLASITAETGVHTYSTVLTFPSRPSIFVESVLSLETTECV
jgi:hypothetical protein